MIWDKLCLEWYDIARYAYESLSDITLQLSNQIIIPNQNGTESTPIVHTLQTLLNLHQNGTAMSKWYQIIIMLHYTMLHYHLNHWNWLNQQNQRNQLNWLNRLLCLRHIFDKLYSMKFPFFTNLFLLHHSTPEVEWWLILLESTKDQVWTG